MRRPTRLDLTRSWLLIGLAGLGLVALLYWRVLPDKRGTAPAAARSAAPPAVARFRVMGYFDIDCPPSLPIKVTLGRTLASPEDAAYPKTKPLYCYDTTAHAWQDTAGTIAALPLAAVAAATVVAVPHAVPTAAVTAPPVAVSALPVAAPAQPATATSEPTIAATAEASEPPDRLATDVYGRLRNGTLTDGDVPADVSLPVVSELGIVRDAQPAAPNLIGEVDITLNGPNAPDLIAFLVFPSADAAATVFASPRVGLDERNRVVFVPYGLEAPVQCSSAGVRAALGGRSGVTACFAQVKTVLVVGLSATPDSSGSLQHGRQDAAIALVATGLRHLGRLTR